MQSGLHTHACAPAAGDVSSTAASSTSAATSISPRGAPCNRELPAAAFRTVVAALCHLRAAGGAVSDRPESQAVVIAPEFGGGSAGLCSRRTSSTGPVEHTLNNLNQEFLYLVFVLIKSWIIIIVYNDFSDYRTTEVARFSLLQ